MERLLRELDARSTFERPAFRLTRSRLLRRLPPGDGHRVIVLPGHENDETHTQPLRRFLADLGYRAEDWGLGPNTGRSLAIASGLDALAAEWSETEAVSLIGLSLGGVHAMELAGREPRGIRRIITMGAPIHDTRPEPSVPTTAIWSRLDRFVPPEQTRMDAVDGRHQHENVRIVSGHCGMFVNPMALRIVGDRLAR